MPTHNELETISRASGLTSCTVHLLNARVGWLVRQAAKDASDEELAELRRVEELALFDIREMADPRDVAPFVRSLHDRGCTVPDCLPVEL